MKSIADFRRIFEAHFTPLVKYSFGITQDKEQSKDIVQSFFIQIWKQYSPEQFHSFEAFAFSSVRNKSLTWLRDQKKFVGDLPEMPAPFQGPIEHDQEYPKYLLESAILSLPDKCKEVFVLSKLDGLTYPEIAVVLDLSVKTVERQISIGLSKLREALEPHRELFMDTLNERS